MIHPHSPFNSMDLHLGLPNFIPHPWLLNTHVMTLFSRWWPRPHLLRNVPGEERHVQVDQDSYILTICHWQSNRHTQPALILVHGLEGCTESPYMVGIAHKAWHAGFNVIRINQRNCGGTEHLTPTLYNNGLSGDILAVVENLTSKEEITEIWLAGYSMGGNLVLRLAGEVQSTLPSLMGVVAVCPNIHPAACVHALQTPRNWIYHQYFLTSMKSRLARKARHFPGKFDLTPFPRLRTLTDFDDTYTAPFGGFRDAADYYERTGARHVLSRIAVPTLIMTAQNDPFVPYFTFDIEPIRTNSWIAFHAPKRGGHCGFIQRPGLTEDLFWAENRVVEFIRRGREVRSRVG